jgi:ribulose-5-phosphate 4-epimerase/fuculose-1-phosphate aldolase
LTGIRAARGSGQCHLIRFVDALRALDDAARQTDPGAATDCLPATLRLETPWFECRGPQCRGPQLTESAARQMLAAPWNVSQEPAMPLESIASSELDAADAAWQARVDLAAAHRLAVMHGLHEGIFNHLTLRVPGASDRYYQIPFGLHWSEVTASCFMEVDYDGVRRAGEGEIEQSCYCIHAPMHRDLPQAAAVFHTHMPHASALARLVDNRILPIGQTELGTMMDVVYDDTYTGPAFDPAEGARLAKLTGDKTVLMMANHGVATIGHTVAEAYDRLYYLERTAQVQLYAMWTGRPLRYLSQAVIETTLREYAKPRNYGGRPSCEWHFAALKRQLDRKEPDYKE